ncbi:efflux RND transporter periplasmic adaptor subunit [Enterovibrio calviensis]|uniref:efflux RND transporter periplasmic adaptor subunit n=1 Tax=Enterovibrio calviensis TaxID=91359 RepID=UPI00048036B6|nr:efflux RND transporter periplasmic adaptor subunit [Enterovibrio calviensis]
MKKVSLSLVASALLLAGCSAEKENNASAAPAATAVTVAEAVEANHAPVSFYVGRIQAMESAKLTPRTTGYLLSKNFEDGALVEKGDVLFDIDPTSYQAALDAAEALLVEATSALELSTLNHNRSKNMLSTGGLSQAQFDLSLAELTMAQSRVESAKANVTVQQDNLEQTKVRAPYSGRIGKSNFSIGDMVGPSFGALTDIIQVSPIEASFSVNENTLAQYNFEKNSQTPFTLEINGQATGHIGSLSFVDNKVNATSGTIAIAAEFDNAAGELIPNQFVRVGVTSGELQGQMIPHKAIHQDVDTHYVMTIVDGVATRKDVDVASRIGQDVFVTEGLESGESVIVGGLQRIRAGAPVVAAE